MVENETARQVVERVAMEERVELRLVRETPTHCYFRIGLNQQEFTVHKNANLAVVEQTARRLALQETR